MRTSLVLLVAVTACSSASGPRQVPVLATQLSSNVVSVSSGVLTATLTASNPSDTTVTLTFTTPPVSAEIKVQGVWNGASTRLGDGSGTVVTVSLTPGAAAQLGSVNVVFSSSSIQPDDEVFSLSPGTYEVAACYFPGADPSGLHEIPPEICGKSAALTLTP